MDETEYIMSSPNRYQLAPIHAWGTTAFRKKDVENAIAKNNEEQGKAQQEAYYTCFDIMQKYAEDMSAIPRRVDTSRGSIT